MPRRGSAPPHDSDVPRELSWDERQKVSRQAQRRDRRARRADRWRNRGRAAVVTGAVAVAVGAVVAVTIDRRSVEPENLSASIGTTAPPATVDPHQVTLARTDFRPGDCARWEQGLPPGRMRTVVVVPCDEEHLIEIADTVTVDDPGHFPTADEWDRIVARQCSAPVERHLGGRLDPRGRYEIHTIQPLLEAWAMGDRQLDCGLGASGDGPGPKEPGWSTPFRGAVSRAAQHWTWEPGTCLRDISTAVSCRESHKTEVVGSVTLAGDTVIPDFEDHDAWWDLIGDQCRQRARVHLGAQPREPWLVGAYYIATESWDAGARVVTCVLGQNDGTGEWAPVTNPATATPA